MNFLKHFFQCEDLSEPTHSCEQHRLWNMNQENHWKYFCSNFSNFILENTTLILFLMVPPFLPSLDSTTTKSLVNTTFQREGIYRREPGCKADVYISWLQKQTPFLQFLTSPDGISNGLGLDRVNFLYIVWDSLNGVFSIFD